MPARITRRTAAAALVGAMMAAGLITAALSEPASAGPVADSVWGVIAPTPTPTITPSPTATLADSVWG
ncbi:hypothetical protein [Kitasatospora sp. NPDC056181]|uniref:hypothetical protein n=1 Tax=Kitasatospora sp. NPDC056181 TaxID=3345737 RepID=UPI0035E01DF4